jgi:hypothetical protein
MNNVAITFVSTVAKLSMFLTVTTFCYGKVENSAKSNIVRGENLLINHGFEDGETGWDSKHPSQKIQLDGTTAHKGLRSLRFSVQNMVSSHKIGQVVKFDSPIKHPIRVSGYCKATKAKTINTYECGIQLNIYYDDNTTFTQHLPFDVGTHDWQKRQITVHVPKPVIKVEVFLLFLKASGNIWFDDISVELEPFEFRRVQIQEGLFGDKSLEVSGTTTLPSSWKVSLHGSNPNEVITQQSGNTLPIRLSWRDSNMVSLSKEPEYILISATDDLRKEILKVKQEISFEQNTLKRDYIAWVESSMFRIMPHVLPRQIPEKLQAQISLASNEYESFQVALLTAPGCKLRDTKIKLTDLVCSDNNTRISTKHIEWHQVGYVQVNKPKLYPYAKDAVAGWWPDPLLPVQKFNVSAGFTQTIWVTVHAPHGIPTGDYVGSLSICPDGKQPTIVEICAHIYNFELPAKGHLKTAFALMDGYLEKVYGKPLNAKIRREYGDFVLKHRLNPDDITRHSFPVVEDLLYYRKHGLNAFNVLNMVDRDNGEPKGEPWTCWSPLEAYTPQFKAGLIKKLDPYIKQLRNLGLTNDAYIYTFDERGQEYYPIIREYFGMIKERYPEIPTLTTAIVPQDPAKIKNLNIDWLCPVTTKYSLYSAEKCRAAGLKVWTYICCGPRYPYSNWMIDDLLIEARGIWWQMYQQKIDGFLYWGFNVWHKSSHKNPIDPQTGPLIKWDIENNGSKWLNWLPTYGDGDLIYPGKDGPIGSIRLANIRDGLEDYEYLWLSSNSFKNPEITCLMVNSVTTGLTNLCRNPETLHLSRDNVAQIIENHKKVNRN